MDPLILAILVCVFVIVLVFGVSQLLSGFSGEEKKIRERLSDERPLQGFDPVTFKVVRREVEIGGFSGVLAKFPILGGIGKNLTRVWPKMSLAAFVGMSAGIGFVVGMLTTVLMDSTLLGAAAGGVSALMPLVVLNNRKGAIEKRFLDQLPEALDFLSRILRAGHSLSTGLQMMAEELPDPMSSVFRRCHDQHSVGQSLDDSLKDAAIRVDNADFGFFVTSILIQRTTGGDLSEVLDNISDMIRQRIRLQQHVKAKTAEGRFTGYVLVVFPVILFFICYYLNPEYPQKLLHTHAGQGLLCLAGGLLVLGTLAIRKITTVKV